MSRDPHCPPMIWMYHSVDDYDEDPYQITVSRVRFERQLDWLSARGLRGVSVGQLMRARQAGCADGLVGLSFDDGYEDFATWVVPALIRRGFYATVFMVAEEIGAYNRWDRGPHKALMSEPQLRWVAARGMEIGSHGLRHRDLPLVGDDELYRELNDSRKLLEDVAGREVIGFAYPYGRLSARELAAVRDVGYDYACAIWRSPLTCAHALPRIYIGDRDNGLRLRAKRARHRMAARRGC